MAKEKPPDYTEENVNSIVEMGFGPDDARDSLKACGNDVNKAIEYILSGGLDNARRNDAKARQWDETLHHADRYGVGPNTPWEDGVDAWGQSNFQFQIQGPDVPPPPVPPRSRAPSPVERHYASAPQATPILETGDDDFEAAIKRSLEDDGTYGPQQSGVTGTRSSPNPNFREATRNDYDPNEWSVVPTNSGGQAPGPYGRKRENDLPAFLKPNSQQDYIPGFLTVMHHIPAARNAFLVPGYGFLEDYEYENGFWDGTEIVIREVEGSLQENAERRLVHEVQRLMAFLDETHRAYGSTESLPKPFHLIDRKDALSVFLDSWVQATAKGKDRDAVSEQILPIMTRAVETSGGEVVNAPEFILLKLQMTETSEAEGRTIYTALDERLESNYNDEESASYFDHIGDVFAIQLDWPENGMGAPKMLLPTELYLDRYSKEYVPQMKELSAELYAIGEEMVAIDTLKRKLTVITRQTPKWEEYDALKVLRAAAGELERMAKSGKREDVQSLEKLREVIAMIESKVEELDRKTAELYSKHGSLRRKYTSPDHGLPPDTRVHYLTGVVTDPCTSFVLIDQECRQWYKMKYNKARSTNMYWSDCLSDSITTVQVPESEVLAAVRDTEDSSVIAVYSTDAAYEVTPVPLPQSLLDFTSLDNAAFGDELSPPSPMSPIKSPSSETSQAQFSTILSPVPQRPPPMGIATPQDSPRTGSPMTEGETQIHVQPVDGDDMDVDVDGQKGGVALGDNTAGENKKTEVRTVIEDGW